MSVILETKQLCKFYGAGENQVKAVKQVDIQIEQGEFVAIVGKSGSGKSTLLHMLGGLDTPTKGSVTLAGKDLYRMKEDVLAVFRRRKIGFVFQAFNLVSSVNVWENIVLPLPGWKMAMSCYDNPCHFSLILSESVTDLSILNLRTVTLSSPNRFTFVYHSYFFFTL